MSAIWAPSLGPAIFAATWDVKQRARDPLTRPHREAQRLGCAPYVMRGAGVTMLGVTVNCGNRTRWRCPRAAMSRFPGMQLSGSCRPDARRLYAATDSC